MEEIQEVRDAAAVDTEARLLRGMNTTGQSESMTAYMRKYSESRATPLRSSPAPTPKLPGSSKHSSKSRSRGRGSGGRSKGKQSSSSPVKLN